MKLFTPKPDVTADRSAVDVQTRPARFSHGSGGATVQLKVDVANQVGNTLVVAGWCTSPLELMLVRGEQRLNARSVRVARADVATHLGLPDGSELGFALVLEASDAQDLRLAWPGLQGKLDTSLPLRWSVGEAINPADLGALGTAMGLLAANVEPLSPDWHRMVAGMSPARSASRTAKGHLEGALSCAMTQDAVVFGWALHNPDTPVWLEDDEGRVFHLSGAYRRFRQDVYDAVGQAFTEDVDLNAGFVVRAPDLKPGARLWLKTLSDEGVHTISEILVSTLPSDPVAAARNLFNLFVPIADQHSRVPLIDAPILAPLIARRTERLKSLPVRHKQLGRAVDAPRVSIIVPLYGRADFVEHQLIEMADDPWLRQHAELIYVIDDQRLLEPFAAQAEVLHRLYRLPFAWVWGGLNRGYSGANNLGAAHARGEHLLFLNSDAFPQKPGWLEALVDVLDTRPDIGAVGPRLLFADGSIQHAGMDFARRDELGIWINHHPRMGLDPSLDPCRELTLVPAVTGACLALRRSDFDRVGGWDTGYLVGDFEDSDLCLKLREQGLHIAYLPQVQLTHLERQSFKLLGQDEFRTRVVIFNAVRHQTRWGHLLAKSNEV